MKVFSAQWARICNRCWGPVELNCMQFPPGAFTAQKAILHVPAAGPPAHLWDRPWWLGFLFRALV